jgi:protein-disulfide isomerase
MSNRQARREQMRASRQQRAAQRPAPSRTPRGGGPSRRRGGGPLAAVVAQPFILLVGLVIIAGLAALALIIALRDSGGGRFVDELTAAKAALPLDMADGRTLGNPDAPVTLTMYEDFQCPFCLQFTALREPAIIDEFVKNGEVRLEFKHLPILGTESLRAARAAVCAAEQNVFWGFHHSLFLTQAEAGQFDSERLNVGRFSDENLRRHAIEAGADGAQFDACFASADSLTAVQADIDEARNFGIQGTPGFAINGRPLAGGAPTDVEGWRELFKRVLDEASATPTGTVTATPEGQTPTPAPSPTPTP